MTGDKDVVFRELVNQSNLGMLSIKAFPDGICSAVPDAPCDLAGLGL